MSDEADTWKAFPGLGVDESITPYSITSPPVGRDWLEGTLEPYTCYKKRLLVYSQNESSLHYITNDLIPAIPAISRASKVETAPVAFLSLPERKLLLLTDSTLTYDVALAQKSCHEECRRIFTLSARSMSPLLLAPPDWSMFSKVCSDR